MTTQPGAARGPEFVPRYARVDVIGGAVMVFIAALVWYGAIGLDMGRITHFGPGAMPKTLAVTLFVAGGAVLLYGLFQPGARAEGIVVAIRPPMIMAIAVMLFALFIRGGDFGIVTTPRLGLMLVGPLTVFIAGFATPEANPKELLVLAFGLTAATLMVFADFLGVPLPVFPKPFQDAIPPAFGVDTALRALYAIYGCIAAGLYAIFFSGRARGHG